MRLSVVFLLYVTTVGAHPCDNGVGCKCYCAQGVQLISPVENAIIGLKDLVEYTCFLA